MPHGDRGKLLRLHFSEADQCHGKPLHEAILAACRDLQITGATVFRGLEGFGETAEIHKHHLTGHNAPIVVVVADSADHIDRLIPIVEGMMLTGTMAVSEVEVIRVQKGGVPPPRA